MSDLNEKLAQEAAELINGGEWRDGKWYSDGQRDAWRRALKPSSDRIEQLEAANLRQSLITVDHLSRIEQLETALEKIAQHDMQAVAIDALHPGERIRKALEGKDGA